MKKWILKFREPAPEGKCTAHPDRLPIAVLQKQAENGGLIITLRGYCQECLDKKVARDPQISVERILDVSEP